MRSCAFLAAGGGRQTLLPTYQRTSGPRPWKRGRFAVEWCSRPWLNHVGGQRGRRQAEGGAGGLAGVSSPLLARQRQRKYFARNRKNNQFIHFIPQTC
jgi:hypothetical protein